METNSQPQETPEYRTFREHYDRLVHAIQDPLPLAIRLFSKGIITSAVKERMIVLGLTTLEKNNALLSAVEKQIQSNPCTLHGFLSALNEDPSLRALVESVQGMCLISEDKKYSNGRQIPYSGKLSREKTCKFHGFVAIHESFLHEFWEHGVLWHSKSKQSAKVFSVKIVHCKNKPAVLTTV